MQVKNKGQRGWVVGGTLIFPGRTEEVECTAADIAGNGELEAVVVESKPAVKVEVKDEDQGMTKAEIVAALKEKGIEFDIASKKADLQALLDGAE